MSPVQQKDREREIERQRDIEWERDRERERERRDERSSKDVSFTPALYNYKIFVKFHICLDYVKLYIIRSEP